MSKKQQYKKILVEIPKTVYPHSVVFYTDGTFQCDGLQGKIYYCWKSVTEIDGEDVIKYKFSHEIGWSLIRYDIGNLVIKALTEKILLGEED